MQHQTKNHTTMKLTHTIVTLSREQMNSLNELADMIHTEKEGTIAYQFADSLIRFNRTEEGDIECEDEEAEAFIRGAQEILIVNTEIARTMQFYEIANFANEDDKFIMFDESLCVLITEEIQAVINKQ